jgi:hypothetical protein
MVEDIPTNLKNKDLVRGVYHRLKTTSSVSEWWITTTGSFANPSGEHKI